MKELKYIDKVHLDKWDIDVKPYLTLKEMCEIVEIASNELGYINKESAIIASTIILCTDVYKETPDITYEQIINSGLWQDVLDNCPILKYDIDSIRKTVEGFGGLELKFSELIDILTKKIEAFNISEEDINQIQNIINQIAVRSNGGE